MKFFSRCKSAFWLSLICFSLLYSTVVSAQDKDWRPVTPAELAMTESVVEPNADAEAIFWEVRIDDSSADLSLRHYVRVKIFNERGRDRYSKFDVPFTKGIKIKDLSARVIRPDGSIVEIKDEDIFEREILKVSGAKVKAKSFAVPNIAPGVIIEYRYKEAINDGSAQGMRLQFQRDIPIQSLSYYYKPYNSTEPTYQSYNFNDAKFVKDKNGFWLATRKAVPALKEEPRMPPDDMVQAWMRLTGARVIISQTTQFAVTVTFKDPTNATLYWGAVSAQQAFRTRYMNQKSADIKKAATEITAGATTDEEKLKKIYQFCQEQIANTTYDATITDEERAKLPVPKSLEDVLKRRSATSYSINLLFGALANASGFDTRIAYSGDRSRMFFTPNMTIENLIHQAAIAVKVGTEWKLFDPGIRYLPYGMLPWYEEDTWALLVGDGRYEWKKTPFTGHEASATKRTAKFTLAENGTLEGDVQVELKGQRALTYRLENYDESPAKREEDLKKAVQARVSVAEISNVSIDNVLDSSKPVIQKYRLRVPDYAQKTGKRLFLQPNFFSRGTGPVFSGETRKYDIFFRYPWSEKDYIEIKLPIGFELDNAENPPLVEDPQKIGSLNIRIAVDKTEAQHSLIYKREFYFGGGGNVLFESAFYQPIKAMFDLFSKADEHTITLKAK